MRKTNSLLAETVAVRILAKETVTKSNTEWTNRLQSKILINELERHNPCNVHVQERKEINFKYRSRGGLSMSSTLNLGNNY